MRSAITKTRLDQLVQMRDDVRRQGVRKSRNGAPHHGLHLPGQLVECGGEGFGVQGDSKEYESSSEAKDLELEDDLVIMETEEKIPLKTFPLKLKNFVNFMFSDYGGTR
ncbi:unnamed protein product [Caenorhabditis brenneri]